MLKHTLLLGTALLALAVTEASAATLNGEPLTFTTAETPLERANVAIFLRQDRLVLPSVRETAHAVIDRAGIFRHAGPGTLELAWVAAGRIG